MTTDRLFSLGLRCHPAAGGGPSKDTVISCCQSFAQRSQMYGIWILCSHVRKCATTRQRTQDFMSGFWFLRRLKCSRGSRALSSDMNHALNPRRGSRSFDKRGSSHVIYHVRKVQMALLRNQGLSCSGETPLLSFTPFPKAGSTATPVFLVWYRQGGAHERTFATSDAGVGTPPTSVVSSKTPWFHFKPAKTKDKNTEKKPNNPPPPLMTKLRRSFWTTAVSHQRALGTAASLYRTLWHSHAPPPPPKPLHLLAKWFL